MKDILGRNLVGNLSDLIDEGRVILATGQVAPEVWDFVNSNKAHEVDGATVTLGEMPKNKKRFL